MALGPQAPLKITAPDMTPRGADTPFRLLPKLVGSEAGGWASWMSARHVVRTPARIVGCTHAC